MLSHVLCKKMFFFFHTMHKNTLYWLNIHLIWITQKSFHILYLINFEHYKMIIHICKFSGLKALHCSYIYIFSAPKSSLYIGIFLWKTAPPWISATNVHACILKRVTMNPSQQGRLSWELFIVYSLYNHIYQTVFLLRFSLVLKCFYKSWK